MKKYLIKSLLILMALILSTMPAFASDAPLDLKNYQFELDNIKSNPDNENQGKNISIFIVDIIEFAVKMAGTVAVIVLIIGGLMMVVSQGNEDTLSKGKDVVKYAIIGLVIIFLSLLIVTFIQNVITNDEALQSPGIPIEDQSPETPETSQTAFNFQS